MALKRSYEVSLWTLQDEFITVLKPLNVENIGQLENKELQLKTDDGLNEYSCSIPMYIYQGTERIENPIWYNTTNGNIISNLRKIKIILNKGTDVEEVYEFLIIKVEERHDKDQLYCDITCEDLAFHELGKQGYKISLSTDVFLDEYNKWADNDGDPATEPHSTLQYWLGTENFLKPVPTEPLATEWYYEVQMNWDAYAFGPSRATDKVYEEEYTSSWALSNGELVPVAVEAYKEKERLVDLQESNIFNLTQDLAQTFEVFVKYQYLYDDNYHIRGRRIVFYNNYIREEEGYIDITYPYEASSITREIDATDVTTKMFVRPVTENTTESGLLSIMNVDANKTKEDYLLNFDYLYSIGAITNEQYAEIPKYEAYMRAYNIRLENLKSCMDVLETELVELEASKTILTNSAALDLERIQDAQDLLNSLDIKDLDEDGAITIGAEHPASAVLLAQDNSDKYYINLSEPGILRETLHIYATYLYTNDGDREAGLYDEITGVFVEDEFGNLIQVKELTRPAQARSSLVYLTYKYVPRLKYEQVEKTWTIRLEQDQAQLAEVEDNINNKEAELAELQEEYEAQLAEKQERVAAFNRMMGPALRESYWQPDDYKANGDNYNDSFVVPFNSLTPVGGSSGHAQFIWDDELFDDEQKSYYNITVLQQPIYYPCIDISNHFDYVINNYDKISFMFYDYLADDPDRYQFKYFRHFALGSQAQLAFAEVGNSIKPVILLTGAESVSLYTLRNMINSRDNAAQYQPKIGIYTPSVDANYNVIGSVDADAFTVTWLNLQNLQPKYSGSGNYDITDAEEFDEWVEEQTALIDNNLQIIGTVEQKVWQSITLRYPRIQIDSMLLKNDESISVHNNNILLEKFEKYYLLTRQVPIDGGEAYQGNWFLTIKPQALVTNSTLSVYFTLSNAQTAIYLDAIQVLKENAYPKVSYKISPTLIHRDFHYTLYKTLNRIVNINDADLKFDNVQGYISELTLDLDNPFNDKIEIKNYRNKFEDLFSSIVAQTESMKKNSYTIGLAAAAFTATGALSPMVIQQSINRADLNYAFNQGTLTIDEENGIWATSDDGVVAMRGGGIFTATQKDDDGNWQWNTGILPQGINADLITTGQLDTNLIRIYAGDKLKFQMNGDGLFAYKSIFEDDDIMDLLAANAFVDASQKTSITNKIESQAGLDLQQYVVHNESGLFLVAKEGSIIKTHNTVTSLPAADEATIPCITGVDSPYLLKELDEDINRVEISWDGLKLRNWNNEEVFYADADTGDLTLKGTVYATGLYIAGTGSVNPPTIQEYVSDAISDAEITYTTQYYVTTSSSTPTGSEAGWTTTPVTALAANEYLWTRRGTTQGGNTTYSSPSLLRTPGGLAALVTLTADEQFFTKALNGTYSPSSITITAHAQNCNITGWYIDNVLIPNSANMTSYTLNAPTSGSEWMTKKVEVRTDVTDISDIITFYVLEEQGSGTSPSYAYLTNENMSFPANSSGTTTAATSYNTALIAQTGSSRVQPTITSIAGTAYSGSAITTNGITITATYDSTNVQYNITVAAANNSTLGGNTSGSIPIVISSPIAQTLYVNWTKSMQGIQGQQGNPGNNGRGITGVVEYYTVTTATSPTPSSGWQTTVPSTYDATNKYLWNYEEITYTTGNPDTTTPAIIGVYGKDGTNGNDGVSITGIVEWYKTSNNSSETRPSGSSSGSTWGDWSTSITQPSSSAIYLWNFEEIQYSSGNPTYTDPARIGNYAADGQPGGTGSPGTSVASIFLYKRAASAPSTPSSTLYYYFSTDKLVTVVGSTTEPTDYDGWTRSIPSAASSDNPCWVTCATANSNTAYDSIASTEWKTASIAFQDGEDGQPGGDGTDGYNSAMLTLYQRSATTLGDSSRPNNLTYTFSTATLSGTLGNWTTTIPADDGNPCYVITAMAHSRTATDTLANTNWSTPVKMVESGTSPIVYELDVSDSSISKNGSTMQPSTLVLSAVKHEGSTQSAVTSGVCYYYAISTDGTSYGTATKITTPSSFSTSGLSSAKLVRFYLYSGTDNTGTLYDWQTVPVVVEGSNGRGISATEIKYGTSSSADTQPSSWGDASSVVLTAGTWLWIRTTISYTDGSTSSVSYSKSYVGTNGNDGTSVSISSTTKVGGVTTVTFSNGSQITIEDGAEGADGYTVILSNENHTFPGNISTARSSSTTCTVSVYEGTTAKAFTIDINSIVTPTGMTISESSGTLTINVTAHLSPTSGTVTIPIAITDTNLTINKTFTYSVSFKGADGNNGDDGVSIDDVIDIYYLQTSGQSSPTQPTTSTTIISTDTPDAWTTIVPTYQTGAQYWRCLKYVFSDNTISFGMQYTDGSMTQAAADAADALAVANSKNATHYSSTEPLQYHRGDIWVNTSDEDGNQYMAMYDYDDASLPQERTERWVRINTKIEGTSMIVDTQNGIISIAAEHDVSISGGNLNLLSNGAINVGSGGSINIASDGHFQIASTNFNVTSGGDVSVTGAITATSLKIGNSDTVYNSVDSLVNDSTLNQYVSGKQTVLNTMTFEPSEGLIIRADNGSPYSTVTKSDGYFIKYNDTVVAGFTGTVTTINQLRIGNIVVKPTSSGGWKWIDAEDI